MTDYKKGISSTTPIASLIANNSGVVVHDLAPNRSAKVRKAHFLNHGAVTTYVSLGTGLLGAYVASTVAWEVLAGMDLTIEEKDLVAPEWSADITAAATVAAAAPANVEVQLEVEDFIGTSG